ncbi:MAG: mechanosensitive ion channel family protein [Pseudohongiellaceae bacterium]
MQALMDMLSLESLSELGWGVELFVVVTLTLLTRSIAMRVLRVLERQLSKAENAWSDALFEAARTPLSSFILIMGLLWAIDISEGYVDVALFSDDNLSTVRQLTFITLTMLFFWRLISQAEKSLMAQLQDPNTDTSGRMDATTLTALAKLLRLSVVISAALIALPTVGIEITALLAFGGVGGIAIGFAAQDLLANFFGGLMIYMDRPFVIGDWIRSPDREVEGTVEHIGWRLTVVRTFDKRPLYIPNAVFTKLAVENPSRMRNRRIKETIGIRYKDADKMRSIVEEVKSMLGSHPDIDTTQTMIVNFDAYGASSLNFFIYTFTKTVNWIEYHRVKEDIMLEIIDIVHKNGADFAFPTTTLDGLHVLRPEPDTDSAS